MNKKELVGTMKSVAKELLALAEQLKEFEKEEDRDRKELINGLKDLRKYTDFFSSQSNKIEVSRFISKYDRLVNNRDYKELYLFNTSKMLGADRVVTKGYVRNHLVEIAENVKSDEDAEKAYHEIKGFLKDYDSENEYHIINPVSGGLEEYRIVEHGGRLLDFTIKFLESLKD